MIMMMTMTTSWFFFLVLSLPNLSSASSVILKLCFQIRFDAVCKAAKQLSAHPSYSLQECEQLCKQNRNCTSFDFSPVVLPLHGMMEREYFCNLYSTCTGVVSYPGASLGTRTVCVPSVLINEQPINGYGMFKFPNGLVYGGYWKESKMHGKGLLLSPEGASYTGELEECNQTECVEYPQLLGDGEDVEGVVFQGSWVEGRQHGKIIVRWRNGDVYNGDFEDGRRTGQGEYRWANGELYTGQWLYGLRHGQGVLRMPEGSVHDGEWMNDGWIGGEITYPAAVKPVKGFGVFRFPTGAVYDGLWNNSKLHGTGMMRWSNGAVYEGEFRMGRRHGWGTMRWPTGAVYDGLWKDGQRQGMGFMVMEGGAEYDGEWEANKKHGLGEYRWSVDWVYTGQWVEGHRQGEGVERSANGDVYAGMWKADVKHGRGAYRWHNGASFTGFFQDGRQVGKGVYQTADGRVYSGVWVGNRMFHTDTTSDGSTVAKVLVAIAVFFAFRILATRDKDRAPKVALAVASAATPVRPLDEEPLDEKPLDEKLLDEKPLDEKPLDEKPVEEKPVDGFGSPSPVSTPAPTAAVGVIFASTAARSTIAAPVPFPTPTPAATPAPTAAVGATSAARAARVTTRAPTHVCSPVFAPPTAAASATTAATPALATTSAPFSTPSCAHTLAPSPATSPSFTSALGATPATPFAAAATTARAITVCSRPRCKRPAGPTGSCAACSAAVPEEAPHEFYCPISMEIMEDPVAFTDGFTYERAEIEGWCASQRSKGLPVTSPKTGSPLELLLLTPDKVMRNLIAAWKRRQPQAQAQAPPP